MRKLLIQANRNAFYYVLDRETGEFLHGKAFAQQTWAKGLDDKGHPIVWPNTDPTPEGNIHLPGRQRRHQLGRSFLRSEYQIVLCRGPRGVRRYTARRRTRSRASRIRAPASR